jgi:hypothetical protein
MMLGQGAPSHLAEASGPNEARAAIYRTERAHRTSAGPPRSATRDRRVSVLLSRRQNPQKRCAVDVGKGRS